MGMLGVAFICAFGITHYLIPLFIALAHKRSILDIPDGGLKRHKEPTPYLGGLAIYLGFIVTLALIYPLHNDFFLFFIGSTVLLFVGFADDLINIKPREKLLGQCVAVVCFLRGGIHLKSLFFAAQPSPTWALLWTIVAAFWILSVINAFNLIDVMDGLATLVAFLSAATFLGYAIILQQFMVALMLAIFMGSLGAFFLVNRPPARMYLGDTGSLFIGGILATVPFMLHWGSFDQCGLLIPPLILSIPLYEGAALIAVRSWKGIPFWQGSPHHFSILAQRRGYSKNNILIHVVLVAAVAAALSYAFSAHLLSIQTVVAIAASLTISSFFLLLR